MNGKQENPRGESRGYTILQSLEALKRLYPTPATLVNGPGGKCSDCVYFQQVSRPKYRGSKDWRVVCFCRFSGEHVRPDADGCEFYTPGQSPAGGAAC